jgi:hypothetical protein
MTNQIAPEFQEAYPTIPGLSKGKAVPSYDPRKPAILAALKKASNCRKVTSVREGKTGFYGNCLNPNNGGNPGFWFVPASAV